MIIPRFYSYSENTPQANCMRVDMGEVVLYFSYDTVVAFKYKDEFVISHNEWGTTTGKHLNWIDPNKNIRIPHEELMQRLNVILEQIGV